MYKKSKVMKNSKEVKQPTAKVFGIQNKRSLNYKSDAKQSSKRNITKFSGPKTATLKNNPKYYETSIDK